MDNQETETIEETTIAPSISDILYGTPEVKEEITTEPVNEDSDTPAETTSEAEPVETAEDNSAEDDSQTEETQGEEDTSTVYVLDGQEYTLEELRENRDSGLRQSDYTKKTQEAKQELTKATALKSEYEGKLSVVDNQLEVAASRLNAAVAGIDWEDLKVSDPEEYISLRESYVNEATAIDGAIKQRQAEKAEEQRLFNEAQVPKFAELLPHWADETKRKADFKEMEPVLLSKGFTFEELNNVTDARIWSLMVDAAKYHTLNARSLETKKVVITPKSSGKKTSKSSPKEDAKSTREILYG